MSALLIAALGIIALGALGFVAAGRAGAGAGLDAATWPLFGLMTAIALSSLLLPRAYQPIAGGVLRFAGIDDRLRSVDEAIEDTLRLEELAAIGARSRDMIGRVRDLLGGGAEDESGGDADVESSESAADTDAGSEPAGLVEAAIRPLLIDTLALVIRALALAGSLAGMLALVAVRIAVRATRAAGGSRAHIEALEGRIASMEARLGEGSDRR